MCSEVFHCDDRRVNRRSPIKLIAAKLITEKNKDEWMFARVGIHYQRALITVHKKKEMEFHFSR